MKVMLIAATAIAVAPFLIAFFLPDWHLGTKQNAIDKTDLTGERSAEENIARAA